MKKNILLTGMAIGALLLTAGCSRSTDMFEPDKIPYTVTDQQRMSHAEKELGLTIDKQQDWVLTSQQVVSVKADADLADISEIQILSGNPYAGETYSLASAKATKGATVNLLFRAPKNDTLFFAACMAKNGDVHVSPFVKGDKSITFVQQSSEQSQNAIAQAVVSRRANATTVENPQYVGRSLPLVWFQHHWMIEVKTVPEQIKAGFRKLENVNTSLSTDEKGGTVSLAFLGGHKISRTTHLGYRIYPKDKPEEAQEFIMNDNFNPDGFPENYLTLTKRDYYWIATFGEMQLVYRTAAGELTTSLPGNMVIDLFVVKGTQDLRADGKTRAITYACGNNTYIALEDGDDNDFQDKMFHVQGSVSQKSEPIKPIKPQVWTYAWEDMDFGDYDMNDCVIEVQENANDRSKLDIKLLALGAARKLWLGFENLNARTYADYQHVWEKELHEVMGVSAGTMVNTGRATAKPISITIDKPAGFDFQTCSFVLGAMFNESDKKSTYVYATDYYAIHIATKGQDPHGIIIPGTWKWPTETTKITVAYPKFADWAKDITKTDAQDWYKHPVDDKVMRVE